MFNFLLEIALTSHFSSNMLTDAIASGWGRIGWTDDLSDQLLKVTLDFFPHAECAESYGTNRKLQEGILEAQQVCAGSRDDNKDTCEGDSGKISLFFDGSTGCPHFSRFFEFFFLIDLEILIFLANLIHFQVVLCKFSILISIACTQSWV